MGQFHKTFNVQEIPQQEEYKPLPDGWYTATIKDAEIKTTKAGTGQYLQLTFEVTGPSHTGRLVFDRINIQNPNRTAEQIGERQIGQLMLATGLATVNYTEEFVGKTSGIKLRTRQSDGYAPTNEVISYRSADGSAKPEQGTLQGVGTPAGNATTGGGTRAPWS